MNTSAMKLVFVLLCSAVLSFPAFAVDNHHVRGHMKKDGTYVAPHRQTNPNRTQRDNWSASGNTNPYTGRKGSTKSRR